MKSLTPYFGVPKGVSNIRMEYDASKSGLNESLWAPSFGLPTIDTIVQGIGERS